MQALSVKVWDLPLRLFHWSLVIGVTIAFLSAKTEWLSTDVHWYAGTSLTFLWIFRILWGFSGSTTARFSQFFPTPRRLLTHVRHGWHQVGHTPTGGLSVMALLLLLAVMIITGVFASDDIALQGPLTPYVDESFSDLMSDWHARTFNWLLGLIALHLIAIIYYRVVKHNNLLLPMITGRKDLALKDIHGLTDAPQRLGWRFAGSALIAGIITWALFSTTVHTLFYQPTLPAPTPASSATW